MLGFFVHRWCMVINGSTVAILFSVLLSHEYLLSSKLSTFKNLPWYRHFPILFHSWYWPLFRCRQHGWQSTCWRQRWGWGWWSSSGQEKGEHSMTDDLYTRKYHIIILMSFDIHNISMIHIIILLHIILLLNLKSVLCSTQPTGRRQGSWSFYQGPRSLTMMCWRPSQSKNLQLTRYFLFIWLMCSSNGHVEPSFSGGILDISDISLYMCCIPSLTLSWTFISFAASEIFMVMFTKQI